MKKQWTPRELLAKTMPFVWAKLIMRFIVIAIVVIGVALGIWLIMGDNDNMALVGLVIIVISILAYPMICFILNRGIGYFIKVGHIAVLTEMIKTGEPPADGMVAHSKNMVTSRIGTVATFFIIDRAVDGAVNQLMHTLERASNLLGNIPGVKSLMVFVKGATKKALKFVDECCIAWIFYGPPQQSAFKGACDGIVIYFQNWKKILGGAVVTALLYMLIQWVVGAAIVIGFFVVLSGGTGSLWAFVGIIVAMFVALAIKQAYLDSWAMIKMLHTYMQVAPTTEIRFDVYNQLRGMSSSFAGLANQIPPQEIQAMQAGPIPAPSPAPINQPAANRFCGDCGAKNAANVSFCGDCGAKM